MKSLRDELSRVHRSRVHRSRVHRSRVGLLALALALGLATSCVFSFERGLEREPGDVAGRAVRDDAPSEAAPYARIEALGASLVRSASSDGTFVLSGLGEGAWVLRLSEDEDRDGVVDRAALRAVELTLFSVDDQPPKLTWVLLGDVRLPGTSALAGSVSRSDGVDPTDRTLVFVFRNTDDLSGDELAGVAASALAGHDLEAEHAVGLTDGTFSVAGVTPGSLRVVAYDPGDESTGAFMSDAVVVTATPAEADAPLAVPPLIMAPVTTTRRVAVDLVFDPPLIEGDEYEVLIVRAGAPRGDESAVVLRERHDDPDEIQLEIDHGAYDVYIDSAPGSRAFFGFLSSQLAYPGGGDALKWGFMQLTPRDPCADGIGAIDRDADGLPGLPPQDDAPELWLACAASCASVVDDSGEPTSCVRGAETFDCDDDHDGQPDVEEPGCLGICGGTDRDGDGQCDRADPIVVPCTGDSCGGPTDGGVAVGDAGVDGGQRAGCSAAVALPASGSISGTLVGGVDDLDACAAPGAVDAIYSLTTLGRLSALRASTVGSTLDTELGVYREGCGATAELGCNDDAPGSPAATSLVEVTDVAAGELFFAIEGWRGAVGDYSLQVEGLWAPGEPCDPNKTSFACEVGTCEQDVLGGGFACTPPRDCANNIDADDDGTAGEDVARCQAPPTVTCDADFAQPVLSTISVSATATDDSAVTSGRWSLLSAPIGSAIALAGAATATTTFTPLLAGKYRLRYVASDDENQLNACIVEVDATTDDVFRVELLWNVTVPAGDPTDLDLHLLHPYGTRWFDQSLDCHFANCRDQPLGWAGVTAPPPDVDAGPDAGFDGGVDAGFDAGFDGGFDAGVDGGAVDGGAVDGGAVDGGAVDGGVVDAGFDGGFDGGFDAGPPAEGNPTLDTDDAQGRGPENINILSPDLSGLTYRVGVHYFRDDGYGPSNAIVKIFCFGTLEAEVGPVSLTTNASAPEQNDFWKAADVTFFTNPNRCVVTPVDDDNDSQPDIVSTAQARLER